MENNFFACLSNSDSSKDDFDESNFISNIEKNESTDYFCFLPDVISSISNDDKDNNGIKICFVCGDKAFGYNFGAITCESCKAFFRRNALKKMIFINLQSLNSICQSFLWQIFGDFLEFLLRTITIPSCAFEQRCLISVKTRKFCTFCRLTKCFEVKMKKENILGDCVKPKRQKDTKINTTMSLDASLVDSAYNQTSSTNLPCCILKDDDSSQSQYFQKEDKSHYNSSNIQSSINFSNEIKNLNKSLDNQIWNPTVITSISLNSKLVSLNDKLSREGQARLLNQDEWDILSGIYKSYIENFIDSGSMPPSAMENVSLSNLVNSSGFIVRKLINFAKCQSEFTSLEQSCQIALLKGAVLNSLILRSAVEYDVSKKLWATPQGEIPLELIKAAGLFDLHDDYAKYCTTLKKFMSTDTYMIPLMQILCLFCYDNSALTDRQLVSDIHDKYMLLLKHYLEAVYGFTESRHRIVSILKNIIELCSLTSKHGQILLHIDTTNIDPLMLEVFNMKLSNSLKNCN